MHFQKSQYNVVSKGAYLRPATLRSCLPSAAPGRWGEIVVEAE